MRPQRVGATDLRGHLRRYVKRGARNGLAACTSIARRWRTGGVRVLTYHRFGDAPYDPFCVRIKDFEAQMAWLAEHRLAVSLEDVQEFHAGRKTVCDNAVLVTVDDGFQSLYELALPILQRHGISAVAFIPVGKIGQSDSPVHDADEGSERHLVWKEVVALSQARITVGSHAWTHRSLGRMSAEEAREEARRSRAVLEDRLGAPVTSFAYPFGTRPDFNPTTTEILRRCGYTCAFTSQHGAIRVGNDPFTLPRIKVEGGESLRMFRRLVRGGLDGWRWVDRTLWRLQAGDR